MESEGKKAIAVQYTTQQAYKSDAAEDAKVFSFRQKAELRPHRTESSRTGAHGAKIWFLLPGKYFVSRQDISGSGKHRCYNAWLTISQDGKINEEQTTELPDFLYGDVGYYPNVACKCLEPIAPEE